MPVFGKLSRTNGCSIAVSDSGLRGRRIDVVFLSNEGEPIHEATVQVTKGKFINAPKTQIQNWIKACGRTDSDLIGRKNDRNTVLYHLSGSLKYHLHFSDFDPSPRSALEAGVATVPKPVLKREDKQRSHSDFAQQSGAAALHGDPVSVEHIRRNNWRDVPAKPGIYWWYFPNPVIEDLRVSKFCDTQKLNLRQSAGGKRCLYVGVASSLRQRLKWHADQRLTVSSLTSGFLSTFRKSLLALMSIDYTLGFNEINRLMDRLDVAWSTTTDLSSAKCFEEDELEGKWHYPLNLQGNRRSELRPFLRFLKQRRREYTDTFSK